MFRLLLFLIGSLIIVFSESNCQEDNSSIKNNPIGINQFEVGGPFENREFMYIDMPEKINSVDTSAGWSQEGKKILITGTIYQIDGKTPAPDVVLYYYHTDINGIYANAQGLNPKVRRHGFIRGWVKSDQDGKYSIYTVRPAAYPDWTEPAHIHPSIKEPNSISEYYIDEFVFDDDVYLTGKKRKNMNNRGGSGVLRLLDDDGLGIAEHNIILGLNILDYPIPSEIVQESGRSIGEDIISFTPQHAWGPDRGKKTCPICKYGRHQGILYFVGNHPDWSQIRNWLSFLERESQIRGDFLKVYFIYGNDQNYNRLDRINLLEKIGQELQLEKVALTFISSFKDKASDIHWNRINPDANNTFLMFRQSNIVDKYINLDPNPVNFELIRQSLDRNKSERSHLKVLEGEREK